LEDTIDALSAEQLERWWSFVTREKIRAFVLAGREEATPATGLTTLPPVKEVAAAVDQARRQSAGEAEAHKMENKGNR
jgi:hypothetical protein